MHLVQSTKQLNYLFILNKYIAFKKGCCDWNKSKRYYKSFIGGICVFELGLALLRLGASKEVSY